MALHFANDNIEEKTHKKLVFANEQALAFEDKEKATKEEIISDIKDIAYEMQACLIELEDSIKELDE